MSSAIKSKKKKRPYSRRRRLWLVLCNVVLILLAVVFMLVYSTHVSAEQKHTKIDAFVSAVESMKQVSANYITSERGYVSNWASYITSQDMTMDEALEYIRVANTQSDRQAHIVDMDTFEASTVRKISRGSFLSHTNAKQEFPEYSAMAFIN